VAVAAGLDIVHRRSFNVGPVRSRSCLYPVSQTSYLPVRVHTRPPHHYDGYPFATLSVFLARSSDLQQYQLATEA
jgi:hypothetical protein